MWKVTRGFQKPETTGWRTLPLFSLASTGNAQLHRRYYITGNSQPTANLRRWFRGLRVAIPVRLFHPSLRPCRVYVNCSARHGIVISRGCSYLAWQAILRDDWVWAWGGILSGVSRINRILEGDI
jgi:hypothetical protein